MRVTRKNTLIKKAIISTLNLQKVNQRKHITCYDWARRRRHLSSGITRGKKSFLCRQRPRLSEMMKMHERP